MVDYFELFLTTQEVFYVLLLLKEYLPLALKGLISFLQVLLAAG